MGSNEQFETNKHMFFDSHIPPEKIGLYGRYDQNGLAKRVAAALDDNPETSNIDTIRVMQVGSTIVLKGNISSQTMINIVVDTISHVEGVVAIDFTQIEVS